MPHQIVGTNRQIITAIYSYDAEVCDFELPLYKKDGKTLNDMQRLLPAFTTFPQT